MLEIKFRAWDRTTKSMRPVESIDWDSGEVWFNDAGVLDSLYGNFLFDPVTVDLSQFTGLLDFHECEVFEGDIIALEGLGTDLYILTVVWDEKLARFAVKPKSNPLKLYDVSDICFSRVVGNVFENQVEDFVEQ